MSRQRSRHLGYYSGGSFSNGWGVRSSVPGSYSKYEYMSDDPRGSKPYPSKGAFHSRTRRVPGRLNGKDLQFGNSAWVFDNYAFNYNTLPYSAPAYWLNWGECVNTALAALSPRKNPVDPLLFLWELRELPRLLKYTGDVLRGRRPVDSDTYLAVTFGWGPLWSDLQRLNSFIDIAENRIKHLEKLQRTKRLEVGCGSDSFSYTTFGGNWYFGTLGLGYEYQHKAETRAWAVGKIKFRPQPPKFDTTGRSRFRAAMGSRYSETAWNMIPWSWLIDYFLSVSSYLAASNGFLVGDLTELCVMQRCESESKPMIMSLSGFTGSTSLGGVKTTRWKRNVYHNPKPGVYITPFLSGKMITNLAALATSSRPRYLRS